MIAFLKRFLFLVLSLIVLATGPALIYLQNYLEPIWNVQYALVMKNTVERGNYLSGADVSIEKVPIQLIVDRAVTASSKTELVQKLTGKVYENTQLGLNDYFGKIQIQVNRTIRANEVISSLELNSNDLYPKSDQMVLPLTSSWVASKTNELSAGDRVKVVPMKRKGNEATSSEAILSDDVTTQQLNAVLSVVVSGAKKIDNTQTLGSNAKNTVSGSATSGKNVELIVNETQQRIILEWISRGYQMVLIRW